LARTLQTLRSAGIDRLIYVGGEPRFGLQTLASHVRDDETLPQCALRGVLAAVEYANGLAENERPNSVVIVACDLPLIQPATIQELVQQLGDHDAVVASGARDHWSCVVVRPITAHTLKTALTNAGSTNADLALATVFSRLRLARVVTDERELTNANHPDVLARIITNATNAHR